MPKQRVNYMSKVRSWKHTVVCNENLEASKVVRMAVLNRDTERRRVDASLACPCPPARVPIHSTGKRQILTHLCYYGMAAIGLDKVSDTARKCLVCRVSACRAWLTPTNSQETCTHTNELLYSGMIISRHGGEGERVVINGLAAV